MTTRREILDDHTAWLKSTLPIDLAGRELYLVTEEEAGPGFHLAGAKAYVSGLLDLRLRGRLESLGLWQGRGDVVIVCDLFFDGYRFEQRGTLIHELGHSIEFRRFEGAVSFEGIVELFRRDDAAAERASRGEVGKYIEPAKPWFIHEAGWVRAVLHLASRAGVPLHHITIAGEAYGLSDSEKYAEALGDEPQRFSGLSVQEILALPAPAAFTGLFAADVARFEAAQAV